MRAAIARPVPVLPEVGSMIVPPGLSRPSASAASTIFIATRSLIEPPGLKYSTLATTCGFRPAAIRDSRTSGVSPTVSRMDPLMSAEAAMSRTIRAGSSRAACGPDLPIGERDAARQAGRDPRRLVGTAVLAGPADEHAGGLARPVHGRDVGVQPGGDQRAPVVARLHPPARLQGHCAARACDRDVEVLALPRAPGDAAQVVAHVAARRERERDGEQRGGRRRRPPEPHDTDAGE